MARPPRNDHKIYVKLQVNQGYRYARAQIPYEDESGVKRYKSVHFGTVSKSLEVLDEMKPIRCIEHAGTAKHITAFVGKQRDICKAFGYSSRLRCRIRDHETDKETRSAEEAVEN